MDAVDERRAVSRWRLILGQTAEPSLRNSGGGEAIELTEDEQIMDQALAAIYDDTSTYSGEQSGSGSRRGAPGSGTGASAPRLSKWLGDVRTFFPEDVVSIIQNDAMERKGWKQLLFEPEVLSQVKPDISMVGTLMALKGKIPEKTKETARLLIQSVVDELVRRLEHDLRRAVTGAINRRQHSPLPSLSGLDWKRTIQRNLKHYDVERRQIVPEKFYYFDRARRSKEWKVIVDIDQSGSMAESIIWASVTASIFASMPALDTQVVAFDTSVVDLTEQCANDPVDMLFGIQLGGGTNIDKSVAYCEQFIEEPKKTLFILISDLYEGGSQARLVRRMREMRESGVKTMCLLALSDEGQPFYDKRLAKQLSRDGTPSFACTPALLPALVEGALKGQDLADLVKRLGISAG
ncbi:VWA domain-containing protein [Paenibacillus sp. 28ISP30-2]|uniref:VWA domain-containing protein n=1 Tax=Paenibacillus sp. 23TSA30-6 TaxID=2546104 RepID=UPI00178875E0|nr:VWA domain-containing protein [Paenibacillus sp. 23TSA30-6]MBE0335609.1 VWA domain-containing protein [Paenibacillus sp. 23TSA30-6]MBE0341659.1 VWA domain-containing protein [Paenibacillus sp. 28ISP30-2]